MPLMDFRIADTFTDSLARLTGQEQKAVKTTAFDLQMNPASPGLSFHKLDRAKDANFWSVRVNADIRLIVHRTASSILLAYVDHHDDAYKWAERRKIERHPTTGAMQLVEVRERVEEIAVPSPEAPAPKAAAKPLLFDNLRKLELMSFGVPEEWVDDVRRVDEDTLFDLLPHLPQEAQEALLKLAVGEEPAKPVPVSPEADPFAHPDAQRRFRVFTNVEELERALDYPWEKWAVFLHPAQQEQVDRSYSGPARVSGSAGTGKTIVALHRAVHLARANPGDRVLLTTFSKPLANGLKTKLDHLVGNEPAIRDRIEVQSITGFGYDLYTRLFGQPNIASNTLISSSLAKAAEQVIDQQFSAHFLMDEWAEVVDAWQLRTWDDYRDVSRLGRKTRIGGRQREALWSIFERTRADLAARKAITWADLFWRLTDRISQGEPTPFAFIVVDEAQDISVPEARFLAGIGKDRAECLFFAGDLGQRIFQQPFSWKSLGLDVRGRSSTLRINYRTSHQIRSRADRLLPGSIADVDGIAESRRGAVSVFNGTDPDIRTFADEAEEQVAVGEWIAARIAEGCAAEEIAVIVRSDGEMKRARSAVKSAGVSAVELSEKVQVEAGKVALSTMHLAKGMEFRAVAVIACDDEVIPQQDRIERVTDESDLEEVYNTERHLLYVACTRARDHLLVTGVEPASEFLEDFGI
ncbi:MAG: UvrD-helicase domain-containing protein [Planctomycetaceae bacterium]|nr:UvrD-helicase domain-containing protein [Planctomycetaceae bacterium]